MQAAARLQRPLRLALLTAAALLHLALVGSMLNQYYAPRTVVNVQLREEQVAVVARVPGRSSLLLKVIRDLQGGTAASPAFAAMAEEQVLGMLDSALDAGEFTPPGKVGLDKGAFCKLLAMRSAARNGTRKSQLVFEAPVVSVDAPGVILTTYFNSRVDPLRCYKHKGGKLQGDALAYIEYWYLSVTRLGLPAVVFHEALSQEFVERVQTEHVRFQRVQLAHHHWSLCDERWAVYLDWLRSSGSRVDYVLQVDVSDTVVARNPFQLFAEQAGQYDLWVNVQRNTQWVRDNYQDCYGVPQSAVLGPGGRVYNAGVVGGKRGAFEALAGEIVRQFRGILDDEGRAVWNCDMAALHYTLTAPRFTARHRVFNSGFPFCAGGVKCWGHGECSYYLYHK